MQTTCTPQTQPHCSSRLATGVRFLDSLPGVRRTPALSGRGTGRMQASAPGWALRAPGAWCGDLRQTGLNPQQGPRDSGRPRAGRRRERQPHPGGGGGSRAGPAGTVFTTGCPGGSGGQGGGSQGEQGDHSQRPCQGGVLPESSPPPKPAAPTPNLWAWKRLISAPALRIQPPAALL